MNLLLNIDSAVDRIAKESNPEKRDERVNEALAGHVDLSKASGRELLHRRALFVTRLRKDKVWPLDSI